MVHSAQYFQDWTLSIQQALPAHFMATIAYMGSKGTHLFSATDVNLINPATGTRPLAAAGFPSQIKENMMTGSSVINALRIILNRQFSNGLFVNANYSWSHDLNDGSSGANGQDTAENVACRENCEWASGDYDVRPVTPPVRQGLLHDADLRPDAQHSLALARLCPGARSLFLPGCSSSTNECSWEVFQNLIEGIVLPANSPSASSNSPSAE